MKRKLKIELSESRPFNSYYEVTAHQIIHTQAYSFMFYYDYFKLCYYEDSLCAPCLFCNSRAFTFLSLHSSICFHGNFLSMKASLLLLIIPFNVSVICFFWCQ